MSREWLTLSQAAEQLGISTRTLRRWIHDGKLRADLRLGPYGQQYLVPISELSSLQVARDVDRMRREGDLEGLARLLGSYLSQREADLQTRLAALEAQVMEMLERVIQRQDAILAEVTQLRAEIERSHEDAKPSAPSRATE
jgi:excisionase family DNA binding protein